jgi:rRNA pseudouridine-1189 N-methylase Emg1 (Nep1/Mra1 family)
LKNGAKYELMNSDDHGKILRKKGRDIAEARPDILHFVFYTLPHP